MKKTLAILAALAVAVTLYSCNSGSSDTSQEAAILAIATKLGITYPVNEKKGDAAATVVEAEQDITNDGEAIKANPEAPTVNVKITRMGKVKEIADATKFNPHYGVIKGDSSNRCADIKEGLTTYNKPGLTDQVKVSTTGAIYTICVPEKGMNDVEIQAAVDAIQPRLTIDKELKLTADEDGKNTTDTKVNSINIGGDAVVLARLAKVGLTVTKVSLTETLAAKHLTRTNDTATNILTYGLSADAFDLSTDKTAGTYTLTIKDNQDTTADTSDDVDYTVGKLELSAPLSFQITAVTDATGTVATNYTQRLATEHSKGTAAFTQISVTKKVGDNAASAAVVVAAGATTTATQGAGDALGFTVTTAGVVTIKTAAATAEYTAVIAAATTVVYTITATATDTVSGTVETTKTEVWTVTYTGA